MIQSKKSKKRALYTCWRCCFLQHIQNSSNSVLSFSRNPAETLSGSNMLKFLENENSDWASFQMNLTVPLLQITIIPWYMSNYFSFTTLKRENNTNFISLEIFAFNKKKVCDGKINAKSYLKSLLMIKENQAVLCTLK